MYRKIIKIFCYIVCILWGFSSCVWAIPLNVTPQDEELLIAPAYLDVLSEERFSKGEMTRLADKDVTLGGDTSKQAMIQGISRKELNDVDVVVFPRVKLIYLLV